MAPWRRFLVQVSIEIEMISRLLSSAAQIRPNLLIQVLPGITRCHRHPDLAYRHPDLCADLQLLRAYRRHLRLSQCCRLQSQPPQSAHQNVSHGRQIKPQLIGSHRLSAHPVSEQTELFFNAVLHVATCAIEFFVQGLAGHCSLVNEVTTKRGFSFPSMCSAFAATRRTRSQPPFFVFLAWYSTSVNTLAGFFVYFHCSVASCICPPMILRSFLLRAIPSTKSTPWLSHQLISSLRQKPESARTMIFTSGQAFRIYFTVLSISSWLPKAAS